MLHRIVKMVFREEKAEEFANYVKTITSKIASFEGCHGVKVLRDINNPNIFFTYSYWDSEKDLENYRHSELFKEVWPYTRTMFAERAQAWTTEVHDKKVENGILK